MTRVGTAGWQIPRDVAACFATVGTTLERYAAVFDAVEINSSFYRPHKPQTWAKWAAATPQSFRFAVKAPKAITHERRLADCGDILERFLDETSALGAKRGPILLQLPPSLAFEPAIAGSFLTAFRDRHTGEAAMEPRHASWFTDEADALLAAAHIARVAADPVRANTNADPGGWRGFEYHRLHGSPRMYVTPYGEDRLRARAARMSANAWCIFDNTMSGAAAADGLLLRSMIGPN